jgi:hypothetical protein
MADAHGICGGLPDDDVVKEFDFDGNRSLAKLASDADVCGAGGGIA